MFEKERDKKVRTGYYFPKVVIKEYSVMIDGKETFLISQLKVV